MIEKSPTGLTRVPYEGPLNARLVVVGESPAEEELALGRPFVGRAGRVLDSVLQQAGISRPTIRILNAVPARAPGDKFDQHHPEDVAWGRALLDAELARARAAGARLIMPLGNNPLEWLAPRLPFPPRWNDDDAPDEPRGRITSWRGSLFPLGDEPTDLVSYGRSCVDRPGAWVMPSYHPAALARQWDWHPLAVIDFKRANSFLAGTWEWPRARKWFVNDYAQLDRFVDQVLIGRPDAKGVPQGEHLVAIDTEMSPYPIVALVSEWEVHAFEWDGRARPALTRLLTSPWVLKVAHNAGHDWTWLRETVGIETQWPSVDTSGLAHILDNSLPRNLSPGIATRFTSWPYHKWLVDTEPKHYCGVDTAVCFDAYWSQIKMLGPRRLMEVADHDHKLHKHLLRMQWRGVLVDEEARARAFKQVKRELAAVRWQWRKLARVVVREKIDKFTKPHLFRKLVKCPCCGGGKVQAAHCWRCGGLEKKPKNRGDYGPAAAKVVGEKPKTVAQLRDRLPSCRRCGGGTKVLQWLSLVGEKKASAQKVADVLYRGLGIRPRKYKGVETIRADQLDGLRSEHPLVELYCQMADLAAQQTTMDRLSPDVRTGRTHTVLDPWGTDSGRTASREGLVQKGTNLQNLEVRYRYVLRADPGYLMVAPDKAQIEGRTIAAASGDLVMKRVYFEEPVVWEGHPKHGTIDAHIKVVQAYMRVCGKQISRDQAKRQTYAMFFGVTPTQLAIELNAEFVRKGEGAQVTTVDTQRVLDYLWGLFSGVRAWHDRLFREVYDTRRCTSPTGRVRTWNGYVRANKREARQGWLLKNEVMKEIRSFPAQDMAAWVLAEDLEELDLRARKLVTPLLHVHDELVVQIPSTPGRIVDEACEAIKTCMTRTKWGMEFPVDNINPAPNWLAAKGKG